MARTRRLLQEALFELAHERGLEAVTVSDVAERAGVNRSTFYQHYSDLDTVLADALDRSAAEAGAQLQEFELPCADPPAALIAFLTHVHEHAGVYRQVFNGSSKVVVLARLRDHVAAATEQVAARMGAFGADLPVDIIAAGVTGSIVGVIALWLEKEPLATPDVAAQWVWLAVMGPLQLQGKAAQ